MEETIFTLDYYVKRALDFFKEDLDFTLYIPESSHTLVIGSQNGYLTGRIIYRFANRNFSYAKEVLAQYEIDKKKEVAEDVTIVSASGSRNIVTIARYALNQDLRVNAIVCSPDSDLKKEFGNDINEIYVPVIDEPLTINTVTYGKMIQGVTHEDIYDIRKFVELLKEPKGGYSNYKAFVLLFPDHMPEVAAMVDWKLEEMLGRIVGSLATNLTNFQHGADIVDFEKEIYVSIGVENNYYGSPERRFRINVPGHFGPLGFLMTGYWIVGQIQKNHPGFQRDLKNYKEKRC